MRLGSEVEVMDDLKIGTLTGTESGLASFNPTLCVLCLWLLEIHTSTISLNFDLTSCFIDQIVDLEISNKSPVLLFVAPITCLLQDMEDWCSSEHTNHIAGLYALPSEAKCPVPSLEELSIPE